MLVQLLQQLVLVLVHARDAAGLRAALVGAQVHGVERLVLDAVAAVLPHDLRRDVEARVEIKTNGLKRFIMR